MIKFRTNLFCFLLLIAFSIPAYAADTYICTYTKFSDENGTHPENFELTFLVDKEAKKSYLMGNIGSTEVLNVNKGQVQAFIEVTDSGNVTTTAIDIKMNSVHSRNFIGPDGLLFPSQYYGTCVKK